jgi:predicted CXXCH cytochrome family protein
MKHHAPRRQASLAFVATAMLIAALVACTSQTRYETLCFFFDGVPEPFEETLSSDQPTTATLAGEATTGGTKASSLTPGPGHSRLTLEQCFGCHDMESGFEKSIRTIEVSQEFCDKCHGERRREEGWNHGPINLSGCLPCHRPGHNAPGQPLLDKPIPELCLYCHVDETGVGQPYHSIKNMRVNPENCVACHDPHRVYKALPSPIPGPAPTPTPDTSVLATPEVALSPTSNTTPSATVAPEASLTSGTVLSPTPDAPLSPAPSPALPPIPSPTPE